MGKTHWDRPAHFIGANDCRFGMTDVVNGYTVSTVGDYRPPFYEGKQMDIGYNRAFETMVFADSGNRHGVASCECNLPEPESYTQLEMFGYRTEEEALAGHEKIVSQYRNKVSPGRVNTSGERKVKP